jgi:hypothetical protein
MSNKNMLLEDGVLIVLELLAERTSHKKNLMSENLPAYVAHDNSICRNGRNRFLGFLNVHKYGWAP